MQPPPMSGLNSSSTGWWSFPPSVAHGGTVMVPTDHGGWGGQGCRFQEKGVESLHCFTWELCFSIALGLACSGPAFTWILSRKSPFFLRLCLGCLLGSGGALGEEPISCSRGGTHLPLPGLKTGSKCSKKDTILQDIWSVARPKPTDRDTE